MRDEGFSYQMLIEEFSEGKISSRYKFLYSKFSEYIGSRGLSEKVYINEQLLHQSVLDYFADVYRLKKFHGIDNINPTKIMAYQIFWLLKRKVLQIKETAQSDELVFINESFAVLFIVHEFLFPDDYSIPLSAEIQEDFKAYIKHLHYHFKYRSIDKQNLELMLYTFEIGKLITKDTMRK
ncbi:MAG: hypothetical protein FWH52_06680 [Synergistaceae bacterium]|nr:hypothetical protein [Synergistaceae bacterium]